MHRSIIPPVNYVSVKEIAHPDDKIMAMVNTHALEQRIPCGDDHPVD